MIVVLNDTGCIGALEVRDCPYVEHFVKWNPDVMVDLGAFAFIVNKYNYSSKS